MMMDDYVERLIVRAATIDELLSDDFEALAGQKVDTELAARRLAAWCRAASSGDWHQFGRRLQRDGWDFDHVLQRFARVRRRASAPVPAWAQDTSWIRTALREPTQHASTEQPGYPFEDLLTGVALQAEARLRSTLDAAVLVNLTDAAHVRLRRLLLRELSRLCAPALYGLFNAERKGPTFSGYAGFVSAMRDNGFDRLLESKPVLLRLIATTTRQWMDTTRELLVRLASDIEQIRSDLLGNNAIGRVARVTGEIGDAHNGGRSVRIVVFESGDRAVYKPKDLSVDVAWHTLIERLNPAAPIGLRAVRTLARDGYGWSEFIEHTGCADQHEVDRYFRRAGAWLALFYCFAVGDMHQENIIAAGEHLVPIDIETILQANIDQPDADDPAGEAYRAAQAAITDSVMMVRLIPSYMRAPDTQVGALGGLIADWGATEETGWIDIGTDTMRPERSPRTSTATPNLPHIDGHYEWFRDHLEVFVEGFETYARFLVSFATTDDLFDGFAGLPVRRVLRPTRFYSMLLHRLKDYRSMDDGVIWSAQSDFVVRLANWDDDTDPQSPLRRAERVALLDLNVPYFVMATDGTEIRDTTGISVNVAGVSGLDRAAGHLGGLDEEGIDWQVTIIRQNMESAGRKRESARTNLVEGAGVPESSVVPERAVFVAEADRIAAELSANAIRRGAGAAWVALDWLIDSDLFQLICLGPGLYNGTSGIGIFFAAHASVTGACGSAEMALASVTHLRRQLNSHNSARFARSLGIGGGGGLGAVVYSLTVMSGLLNDERLLADARTAAALLTDDLIAADTQLDVIGGGAGAILGLLRLHRDIGSPDLLATAIRCGEHLLDHPRIGPQGRRTWRAERSGSEDLNGISHGAAGYAYALAALAEAAHRDDFARAAAECVAFENGNFDPSHGSWADLRSDGERVWPCKWCHGAPGIGLARAAMLGLAHTDTARLLDDIRRAVTAVEQDWLSLDRDTLCCGTPGSVELLDTAATVLGRPHLHALASRRMSDVISAATRRGDYRWAGGTRRFNPGMFQGLAGVGYTALRRADSHLPNVLVWQ